MRYIVITFFITFIYNYSFTQNKIESLNSQKKDILSKIDQINNQVLLIEKSKKNNITTIKLQKNKIKLIENLLENNKNQIISLNINIQKISYEIDSLNILLDKRKIELLTLYKSYYKKLTNKNNLLILFLASNNFNQFYVRFKMYKTLVSFLNKLILNIKNNLNDIQTIKENYVLYLKDLKIKQNEYSDNLKILKDSEKKLSKTILQLEKRKNDLVKEVNINKQKLLAINNEIRKVIISSKKKSTTKNLIDKDYLEISKKFKDNKGKLPPPVIGASILNEFGQTKHPILKNVIVKNNGIDLIVYKDIVVRNVYPGIVSKIFNLPFGGYAVIVRHGEFLTVYSNLSEVFVSTNEFLKNTENIGKTLKQPDNTYVLHFELWNEKEPENPLIWINI